MASKLKPRKDGPMDKFVKKETNNQDGESSQAPNLQPVAKEEEPHASHSFEWCGVDKTVTTATCNKAGTVEDVLKRSAQFTESAGKNKDKELVIEREAKAISSHFPCNLIKENERLTVRYIKAVDKLKQSVQNRVPVHPKRKRPSGELMMFHVLTRGGKNVVEILRNPALKADFREITLYAYKGEKVKQALRRDGRLQDKVFKKNCVLLDKITDKKTEMSSPVDVLNDKTFQIILLNKSSPPESQPGSLEDAYMMQNESQRSDSDGNQDPPQQSSTNESVSDNTSKEKPNTNGDVAPEYILGEMPNSKEKQCHLSSQFRDLVKRMIPQPRPQLSRIQNLFRVEYGKSTDTCREVKTMKTLMELSSYVCQVRINGKSGGSGFLLFDKFVLTNGHVVKNIYDQSTGQLNEKVTVHFSFESLDQAEGGQDRAEVEEVAGFEFCLDASRHDHDWALLKLKLGADQKLPDGLLTHFGFLPQSGGICIVGHPDGGVKKIDPCFIIPTGDRNQVLERHSRENPGNIEVEGSHYGYQPGPLQLVTHKFFDDVKKHVEQKRLTYETCFYFGSSGSPVFDEHCNVVAMHSGGFVYSNNKRERQSVIEFGHPLSVIIEHIIVQVVETGKFSVLKKYLACSYKQHQNVMTGLKRLVESRNLEAFKTAVNNPMVVNDESLKTFFEFLSLKEEPVPMDIAETLSE